MGDDNDDRAADNAYRNGGDFVVVDDTESAGPDEATPRAEPEPPPLNAARVRQLSALRRGAYRARSYCLVAVAACAVAEGQLVLMTVRHVRALGWGPRPLGYLCGIVAAMMAAAFVLRRAAELNRELRTRTDPPAEAAGAPETPDFSTLSDGSHAWKNLEQMRENP
jgi:hypothetical protein